MLAVEVKMLDKSIVIINTYASPVYSVIADIKKSDKFEDVMWIGELNCRHEMWGDNITNTRGRQLFQTALDLNASILIPEAPTRVTQGVATYLDLCVVKGEAGNCCIQTGDHFYSDHLPIVATINLRPYELPPREVYVYSKADWKKFRSCLDEQLAISSIGDTRDSLDKAAINITTAIQKAAELALPKKVLGERKAKSSEKLKELKKTRNKARKKRQKSRLYLDHLAHVKASRAVQNEWVRLADEEWAKVINNTQIGQAYGESARHYAKA